MAEVAARCDADVQAVTLGRSFFAENAYKHDRAHRALTGPSGDTLRPPPQRRGYAMAIVRMKPLE
ncbi:MAG: hypothetical protein E6Q88_02365 [Lysobacteraceae bacterium]|nr:MAG: hypothetical protein E6Q88_02365 [Xanthomonadaceae bacterium]